MSVGTILVWMVLTLSAAGDEAELLLKDGTKLVGVVRETGETGITFERSPDGERGASGTRHIAWKEIEELDGLTIAGWLGEQAIRDPEAVPEEEPIASSNVVDRFQTWLGQCRGMSSAYAIGALALLVLVPAWILHQAGKLMGMRELEPTRSLFAALLSLGAAWAALKAYPAWVAGVPWLPAGATALMIWLAIRPTVGRWVVLSLLEIASLVGVAYGVLYLVRFAP